VTRNHACIAWLPRFDPIFLLLPPSSCPPLLPPRAIPTMAATTVPKAVAPVTKAAESLLDPLALITPARSLRVLTRQQIAFAITQGHVLTIHRGFVYRLNGWLNKHPGADLPVLHFVGRDATDEIEAYHPVYALKMMRHHIAGRIDGWEDDSVVDGEGWKPLVPPLHLGWPGKGAAYTGVPSLDETMELMKVYEADGYPCSGTPKGTSLPWLTMADLEPPTAPSDIDRKEQQRIAVSFRKFRNEVLQIDGLFDVNPWPLYRYTILRCAGLFATFLTFYLYASQKCESHPLCLFNDDTDAWTSQGITESRHSRSDSSCTRSCLSPVRPLSLALDVN
jgi:hypothetical protein